VNITEEENLFKPADIIPIRLNIFLGFGLLPVQKHPEDSEEHHGADGNYIGDDLGGV
jgi:hypothetical protein